MRPRPLTEPPRLFAELAAREAPEVEVRVLKPGKRTEIEGSARSRIEDDLGHAPTRDDPMSAVAALRRAAGVLVRGLLLWLLVALVFYAAVAAHPRTSTCPASARRWRRPH